MPRCLVTAVGTCCRSQPLRWQYRLQPSFKHGPFDRHVLVCGVFGPVSAPRPTLLRPSALFEPQFPLVIPCLRHRHTAQSPDTVQHPATGLNHASVLMAFQLCTRSIHHAFFPATFCYRGKALLGPFSLSISESGRLSAGLTAASSSAPPNLTQAPLQLARPTDTLSTLHFVRDNTPARSLGVDYHSPRRFSLFRGPCLHALFCTALRVHSALEFETSAIRLFTPVGTFLAKHIASELQQVARPTRVTA